MRRPQLFKCIGKDKYVLAEGTENKTGLYEWNDDLQRIVPCEGTQNLFAINGICVNSVPNVR